jgi:coenzyme F420 hydrogenase subunit beta
VVDVEQLNQRVFGAARDDYLLGTNRGVFMSQAAAAKTVERGQYGGTVSALLAHGLKAGTIDGAIVAGDSPRYPLLPEPILARTPEEVLAAAGSKFSACPSLAILDKSVKECEKLAVVCRPCQAIALRKRIACQAIALRKRIACEPEVGERVALIVGIFCMWALDYKKVARHLGERIDLDKTRKIDIPYNRFVVTTTEGEKELPFEPIREMRRSTCDLCYDFTAELADLSVGSTEWKDDWNTAILRTERGERAARAAEADGVLEIEPLPAKRIELLRKAAGDKKKRVLGALARPECPVGDYLVLGEAERRAVAGE